MPASQEPETRQTKQDCDIDESLKAIEDCPSETIIAQYREKYDLTVALRGGFYWQVISGEYVNEIYGYRVILADGVEGLCLLPPMPYHGFIIDVANDLSPLPDARENPRDFWEQWRVRLYVDASYNSLDYASADDAANASLGYCKEEHPDDLIVLNRERTNLRRIPASRYLVQFLDARSGETMIDEEVVAIRAEEGIIYTIGLTTTAARYSQDERVVRQVLRGMRFTKPE